MLSPQHWRIVWQFPQQPEADFLTSTMPCRAQWQFKRSQTHCICSQSSWPPFLLLPIRINHHRPTAEQEGFPTTGQHLPTCKTQALLQLFFSLTRSGTLASPHGLKDLFFLKEQLMSLYLESWIVWNPGEKGSGGDNSRVRYSESFQWLCN